ncbi:helix-turn-helix domain-containing protein [Brevundimonas nasdae]|uniref:helix-turn-helix domain-containing protein n=1 Tax=Brevundimonas nasdae TaxID=172043 RepID=UPI003F68D6F3
MMTAERQHQRIKGALKLRGSSLSAVARSLDVTPTTVTIVSKGVRRSRRIEAAIANALGMTPDALWPERYIDVKATEAPMT